VRQVATGGSAELAGALLRALEVGLVDFKQALDWTGLMAYGHLQHTVAPHKGPANGHVGFGAGFANREARAQALRVYGKQSLVLQPCEWRSSHSAACLATVLADEALQPVLNAKSPMARLRQKRSIAVSSAGRH